MTEPHTALGGTSACTTDDRLHCSNQPLSAIVDKSYWLELCPYLSIEGRCMLEAYDDDVEPFSPPDPARLEAKMARDGYYSVSPPWEEGLVERLRQGVLDLERHGWQATFITVFDEAWLAAYLLRDLVSTGTGGAKAFNCDWLGYLVRAGEAGMPPHRDFARCPGKSWADDAQTLPRVATAWLALGDVTPETSCLYFLPARCDRLYRSGACEAPAEVFDSPARFQDVAAVPLRQGEAVVFSHRVYHWGSAAAPDAAEPRVALAMGFSDPEFKAPYLEPAGEGVAAAFPAVAHRVALCAAQMVIYNKRHTGPWPLTHSIERDYDTLAELMKLLWQYKACGTLDQTYVRTVLNSPVVPHIEEHMKKKKAL